MRPLGIAFLLSLALACGSSNGGTDPGPGDAGPDGVDVPGVDVPGEDVPPADVPPADVPPADVPPADVPADEGPDAGDPGEPLEVRELPEFTDVGIPGRALPFAFTRPPVGEDIPAAEVTEFSKTVAAAWKETGYFRWLLRTSIGVDPSTGKDDFLAWYSDIRAVKAGDTVTFEDPGNEHNMWIPGSVVLAQVMGGYLWTGDWEMARLTEQYCKGLTAVVKGFRKGEDDPAPFLMARAVFPQEHAFTLDADFWKDDGRKKAVTYLNATRQERDEWNAQTFPWTGNPAWGDIWVTNMRSKDDVRAISRAVTFLYYVVEDAKDDWVKSACQETLDTMVGFHKDIVDEDYFIRTKDRNGVAYRLPCDNQKDLGSYNCFTDLDPTSECCARLAADMIAYGERRTADCGTCTGSLFDQFASIAHYYNIPIIWDYHMAGVGTSLVKGRYEDAYVAMLGLAQRTDAYMHGAPDEPGTTDPRWGRDMALYLVQAASMGLPLTALEARHVQKHWLKSVEEFTAWKNWDLWDASVPDGTYSGGNLRPHGSNDGVEIENWAILLEYCASPFRNPASATFVDCDVLKDPATW